MKRKQFVKGIRQIAQEGAIQVFQEIHGGMEEIIVGVVGVLQFDVLKFRIENEYNVDIRLEMLPYEYIRWIENWHDVDLDHIVGTSDMKKVEDMKGQPFAAFCQFLVGRNGPGPERGPCADRILAELTDSSRRMRRRRPMRPSCWPAAQRIVNSNKVRDLSGMIFREEFTKTAAFGIISAKSVIRRRQASGIRGRRQSVSDEGGSYVTEGI